ncbi:sensor histidine kinase [Streptomyces sp. NPDC018610]|uniref:sensor histidine kinase n=1 Tax=Streptomyces sp. NPDC018610 TaxID=3365049 RepID=UPI00379AEBDB
MPGRGAGASVWWRGSLARLPLPDGVWSERQVAESPYRIGWWASRRRRSFRRAGLEVSARREGSARPLPPGLDLTAYRTVQEALTNVTKHAGSGSARVGLHWDSDRVILTVADGAGGALRAPGLPVVPDRPPGHGLIGMRERATAVGGRLHAGRRPEGGFLVTAELPLPRPRGSTGGSLHRPGRPGPRRGKHMVGAGAGRPRPVGAPHLVGSGT